MISFALRPLNTPAPIVRARFWCASGIGTRLHPSRGLALSASQGKLTYVHIEPEMIIWSYQDQEFFKGLVDYTRDIPASILLNPGLNPLEYSWHEQEAPLGWGGVHSVSEGITQLQLERINLHVQQGLAPTREFPSEWKRRVTDLDSWRPNMVSLGVLVPWTSCFHEYFALANTPQGELYRRVIDSRPLAQNIASQYLDCSVGRFYQWHIITDHQTAVVDHGLESIRKAIRGVPMSQHPLFQLPPAQEWHPADLPVWIAQ